MYSAGIVFSVQVVSRDGWIQASGWDVEGWYADYDFDAAYSFLLNTTLPPDEEGPLPKRTVKFLNCLEVAVPRC